MEIHVNGTGPPELKRPDGWIYRLHGIGLMEMRWEYTDRAVVEIAIYDLSDRTFDSIRVLRDEFPDWSIRLIHDI